MAGAYERYLTGGRFYRNSPRRKIERVAGIIKGVPDLWVLTHRESGPIATFLTKREANEALVGMARDESAWLPMLRIEPFDVVVDAEILE